MIMQISLYYIDDNTNTINNTIALLSMERRRKGHTHARTRECHDVAVLLTLVAHLPARLGLPAPGLANGMVACELGEKI